MKKILLMMVAFAATMYAFAQDDIEVDDENGWSAVFSPVESAKDMSDVHVAQAGDGSVYVSSRQNTDFEFAGKTVAQPEVSRSSVILKYDKEGTEQWAVTLEGDVTVTAMVADEDGTLYAAGMYMEDAEITDAANGKTPLTGSYEYRTLFIVKIAVNGTVQAVKTMVSETDKFVASQTGPNPFTEEVDDEMPLYMGWDPIYIKPTVMKIHDGKLYVAAEYLGDVAELQWEGAYLLVNELIAQISYQTYYDEKSRGVFSLNTSDLSDVTSVMSIQQTELISENQSSAMSLNFDFDDKGNVCYAFVGFGNRSIVTPHNSEDFSFEDEGDGGVEYAFVGGVIKGTEIKAQTFHASVNDSWKAFYDLVGMYYQNGVIYIGGTCFGNFWFDRAYDHANCYSFSVAINAENGEVKWMTTESDPENDVDATAMVVTGEELHLATTAGSYTIQVADGTEEADFGEGEDPIIISDAAEWKNIYAATVVVDGNEVYVVARALDEEDADAIESVDAADDSDGDAPVVNLMGQPIDESYKGIAITADGKKVLVK